MIDLSVFFVNPFRHTRSSFAQKRLISEEHIGSLVSQNTNHQYDTMLALTVQKHNNFFGDITNLEIKIAIQVSQTSSVNKIIKDFKKRCSKLNAYFISTELNKDPMYHLFFPLGVQKYTRKTNKGNIETHIKVLVDAITQHTAEAGGASVLADFVVFQTGYANSRLLQSNTKGQTSAVRSNRNEAEIEWAEQMFDNLLVLAREYKDKPEKLKDFFAQHYLHPIKHKASEKRGVLVGKITRMGTDLPEQDVKVHVVDAKINNAYSKSTGKYRSQKIDFGFHTIIFSKPGFISQEIKTEIKDAGTTTLNVVMEVELAATN